MSELSRDLARESQTCLENAVNEAVWNGLNQIVRAGVLTSEMCIRSLDTTSSRTDFSAAIMPLMKVLENELINCFYLPYKNYLRTHFSAAEYVERNGLVNLTIRPEDARRKILFCDRNGVYGYTSDTNRLGTTEFTLGNFAFTAGVRRPSRNECDQTAVLFYKQQFFGMNADDTEVEEWICKLARDLDALVLLRNNSAHAGVVQSLIDANTAMDSLVKVDKILFKVINPRL